MTDRMAELAHESVLLGIQQLKEYSPERESVILANEDKLDLYEDRLGSYLVQVSRKGISMEDARHVTRLLHSISNFERIGDHALNLHESAQELHDKGITFSAVAQQEVAVAIDAVEDILDRTFRSFAQQDATLAMMVEPLEETIDHLTEEIRTRHIERLQQGTCTIQLGFVLNDLLTNLERVSDHCSNIAVCVLESERGAIDSHTYLQEIKASPKFLRDLEDDLKRYTLP